MTWKRASAVPRARGFRAREIRDLRDWDSPVFESCDSDAELLNARRRPHVPGNRSRGLFGFHRRGESYGVVEVVRLTGHPGQPDSR